MTAITVAAGSTFVAIQAIGERNELHEKYIESTTALDNVVEAVARYGPSKRETREKIFAPAIAYYSTVASGEVTEENVEALPEIASAKYHLAALLTKLGKSAGGQSLASATEVISLMRKQEMSPDRFPSLNASALKLAAPPEWVFVKDANLESQAMLLIFTISKATGLYQMLSQQHPEVVSFRDDLAAINEASGALQSQVPQRHSFAVQAWQQARDLLEQLAQDTPRTSISKPAWPNV